MMVSCLPSQKAPSAIRCIKTPIPGDVKRFAIRSQKAPSAIRCIKTHARGLLAPVAIDGQKAPSAIRCIKTLDSHAADVVRLVSESTERHKVH